MHQEYPKATVWVLGDHLNRSIGALGEATPRSARVLLVEATDQLATRRYHRQRLHLVLAGMRRFAAELRAEGFEVDERRAPTLLDGLEAHRREHGATTVRCSDPQSYGLRRQLERAGVQLVRSQQFLCHYEDFATWAGGPDRRRLRMEDFYRWQRQRLGYLMDGDRPAGGRWNLDVENREPPPRDGRDWPTPRTWPLDDLDHEVLAGLPDAAFGADPVGLWATTRAQALERLDHVIEHVLPGFGPHEDAMLREEGAGANTWSLNHTLLSHALNIGLLLPAEVADRIDEAYNAGAVPLQSAEGLLRQVIGWREYVWGIYWLWMPGYRDLNGLDASRPLPPAYLGEGTHMACVHEAVTAIEERAWAHHIQRLMVLANFAMLADVEPQAVARWMAAAFIDGSEWVMVPNIIGMAMHADGGRMATKPYAGGGAYINRMSDYCGSCRYDPRKRTGADACPFTTLYWDFLARKRPVIGANPRMRQTYRNLDRLRDVPAVRARAEEVLQLLDAGQL